MVDFYKQTHNELAARLHTSLEDGLSYDALQKAQADHGRNELKLKGTPIWRKIVEPFWNIFVAVLLVALGISLYAGEYIDASVIAAVVTINAVIFWIQEYSTERVLRALKQHDAHVVAVVRQGDSLRIPTTELVPGDLIELSEGQKVPADARVVVAESFSVSEAVLTGESIGVHKYDAHIAKDTEIYAQRNMVFQGTFVLTGTATALVVATGNNTEFGKIATLASTQERAPMQQKIDTLAGTLTKIIAGISITVFVLALLRGVEVSEAGRFVIAMAVSAVPEGLPVALSVILVLAMRRMARRKALVRSMQAIENVGLATVIATDKTGTLTENVLRVRSSKAAKGSSEALLKLSTHLSANIHDKQQSTDPLDTAFADYTKSTRVPQKMKFVHQFSFVQDLRMSGVLWREGRGYELYVKGSPEHLLQRSKLSKAERTQAESEMHKLSSTGHRVIAVAHASLPKQIDKLGDFKGALQFDGFVAIADALRPEAASAISEAHQAGVSVKMITGDHYETAFYIGKELGLTKHPSEVFNAEDSRSKISASSVNAHVIFSRILPKDKMKILESLKKKNITVMTGDGVNDVPAISAAHVGVAMGSGSDIAKESSDVVLLDDNFETIVTAIREGRIVYANIRKMLYFVFATSFGEALTMIGALVIGLPLPVVAVQILWINLVTDTAMVLPIGLEPPESDVMRQPPRDIKAPLLGKVLLSRGFVVGLTLAVVTLIVFERARVDNSLMYAQAIAFTSLVVGQWANALNARSEDKSFFVRVFTPNTKLVFGFIIAVLLQLVVLLGPLKEAFHIPNSLSVHDVVFTSLLSFGAVLVAGELHKLAVYILQKR